MLKEKKFYEVYGESGISTNLTLESKKKLLYELYMKQMKKHIELKSKQLIIRKSEYEGFNFVNGN